jgi:hypothetical protein
MNDKPKTEVEEQKPLIDKEIDELEAVLRKDDSLVPIILRYHLLVENLLERIIIAKLPKSVSMVEETGFTFHHKLELVQALDVLKDNVIGSLRKLNKIRNDISHSRNAEVSHESIDSIGKPLGKNYFDLRKKHSDYQELAKEILKKIYSSLLVATLICEYP